ncbi:MAG: acyl-CoA thioesterase [Chitinophagaceae bacterium]|jgi:acyl-CoA hydrolase|nr:acyl-CoA thioesterase [Chitinophagaceae bacterium]MCU0403354.1 acyl-CoA thioesterase [Chitinophagaceae bacterium]
MEMLFHTRKWVKPEDLNPNNSLFGGRLLQWIDEEAVIYAIVQLETPRVVTKYISEINFISAPRIGDIVEIGIIATDFGASTLTVRCEVRNLMNHKPVLSIDRMVFASVNENGKPIRHGKTKVRVENEVREHYFVD